jgi:hypothetical protein
MKLLIGLDKKTIASAISSISANLPNGTFFTSASIAPFEVEAKSSGVATYPGQIALMRILSGA